MTEPEQSAFVFEATTQAQEVFCEKVERLLFARGFQARHELAGDVFRLYAREPDGSWHWLRLTLDSESSERWARRVGFGSALGALVTPWDVAQALRRMVRGRRRAAAR